MPRKPKPKSILLDHTTKPGCADLLEVALFAPQGANEEDFLLCADVRFGTMAVSSDDWSKTVEIGLSKATLSLTFKGCAIDPGTPRFGDQRPVAAKTQLKSTQVATSASLLRLSGGGGGRFQAIGSKNVDANVSLAGSHSRDSKVSTTEVQSTDFKHEPVVSMPNSKWRFSSVASNHMQSRYSGDEALCKILVQSSPMQIEGRLSFQPKDIVIVDVDSPPAFLDRFRASPNKAAVAKVLLARYLKEVNELPEAGEPAQIVGSLSVLRGEIKSDE